MCKMFRKTEIRQYIYDKSNRDSGNFLIITRLYWFFIFPIYFKVRKFNTDNALWINNDVFGYGNEHNIEKAFNEK